MANESEVIRHQMEETRTSLQDKLETLEQQVMETVETAKEGVKETVSTVKEAVHETVDTVKETMHDTVSTVKETFDLRHQTARHPCAMFFGAMAAGFIGGHLLQRTIGGPPHSRRAYPLSRPAYEPPPNVYRQPMFSGPTGAQQEAARTAKRSWWDTFTEQYQDELNKVKGLAVSTVGSLVGEILAEAAPPQLAERIREVVDGMTVKLGGQPFEEPLVSSSSGTETGERGNGQHPEETTSRPVGSMRRQSEEDAKFDI